MILHGKHPKTNWPYYVAWAADKGTVGEANQLVIGAGFRDVAEYRWIPLTCKDAYEKVVSAPSITFKQGYLTVDTICNRFNITATQFWTLFKNFCGDGPFTYKGKPWFVGVLFFVATHGEEIWLKNDLLLEMKQQHNFSFETCSHEDAVKLLTIPADLRHLRTLD